MARYAALWAKPKKDGGVVTDSASLLAKFLPSGGQAYQAPLFTPYLSLNQDYAHLLEKLDNPQNHLPPVLHVGGTNGKGSTCAFLRALTEAAGKKAHVYTSPHLVSYHERIRIAGDLISEEELTSILSECVEKADLAHISNFEATTAAALVAFARHKADVVILEVGLGGRLDATNIIEHPVATIISRLSFDHRDFLGSTMASIAREKAAIMRPDVPCFVAHQPDSTAVEALEQAAKEVGTQISFGQKEWGVEITKDGFVFHDAKRRWTLPAPALLGDHQYWNAGLALAASRALPFEVTETQARQAMKSVAWPARLQRVSNGRLAQLIAPESELWLDGGHNDSAGEVLALQLQKWKRERPDLPIHLICGMISTKKPTEFLAPLTPYCEGFQGVAIPREALSLSAEVIESAAQSLGLPFAQTAPSVAEALRAIKHKARILICGSLYLAGTVLDENGV